MVIVAFPVGAGGHFLGNCFSMLNKDGEAVVQADGSCHGQYDGFQYYHINNTSNDATHVADEHRMVNVQARLRKADVIIGHMRDIAYLRKVYPDAKIVYVTVGPNSRKQQEANFVNKVMIPKWSGQWYNYFKGEDWPEFMRFQDCPEWIIQEIKDINMRTIDDWTYNLPKDLSNTLELSTDVMSDPAHLVRALASFVSITPEKEAQLLEFATHYKEKQPEG